MSLRSNFRSPTWFFGITAARLILPAIALLQACGAAGDPAPLGPMPATQPVAADLADVDVKFMVRGYCFAGSRIKDEQALGGFGPSDNLPWQMPKLPDDRKGQVY